MASVKDQTVHAGHTIRLKIAGAEVGRAQSLSGRRSFGVEAGFFSKPSNLSTGGNHHGKC